MRIQANELTFDAEAGGKPGDPQVLMLHGFHQTHYSGRHQLAMIESLGYTRAHVIGHDWGGQLSWLLAAHYPDHAQTLTVLSRPHPQAFLQAMRSDTSQADRSKHHRAFQDACLSVLRDPGALDAAIHWYRAPLRAGSDQPLAPKNTPPVTVPTRYVWGDADATVGRAAADATAECRP